MRPPRRQALFLVSLACPSLSVLPATATAVPRCADANTRPGNASEPALSKATVCLINSERTRRGLRALRTNRRLSQAALSLPAT